ncbi:MAG: hypothetical protein P8Z79_14905 [Sedimentisphaerales bacterium]
MLEESKTSNLNAEKLGHLLRLYMDSNEEDERDRGEDKEALLGDLLSDALPLNEETIKTLPSILKRLYEEMPPLVGKPLGCLLLSSETELEHLMAIKEHAKKMMSTADTNAKYETRAVIYYAAIAGALVFHDRKISTHSNQDLEDSLSALAKRKWIKADLSQLLKKAEKICHLRG